MNQLEAKLLQLARIERDVGTIRFLYMEKHGGSQDDVQFPLALERLREMGWVEGVSDDRWLITAAGAAALADEENWEVLVTEVRSALYTPGATEVIGEIRKGSVVLAEDFSIWHDDTISGGGAILSVTPERGPESARIVVHADSVGPGDLLRGEVGYFAPRQIPGNLGPVEYLTEWYTSMCDGDWEHSFGVRIGTLDNPGWTLSVDPEETNLEGAILNSERIERSDSDWISVSSDGRTFRGSGGPKNLPELLERFREFSIRFGRFRGNPAPEG